MAKTTIKNINKVLSELKQLGKDAEKRIEETTQVNALDIVADAKVKAPKDKGKLAQSIYSEKNTKMNYSIVVGLDYGAYVEFGTGKYVNVPTELKDVASSFKGRKGDFKTGLQSIKDWCRGKGIDEKYAYPIFISILRNGIQAQPFLYPAFVKGREQYLKDLKGDLNELTNKYNG